VTAAGRNPSALRLVVVSLAAILEHSLGEERANFVGTLDEVKRDLERLAGEAIGRLAQYSRTRLPTSLPRS
jgi:hypothetical protein